MTRRTLADCLVDAMSTQATSERIEVGEHPTPRLIKTFADAEQYASEYMRYLGFADALPTPAGSDGGIDVVSAEAIAHSGELTPQYGPYMGLTKATDPAAIRAGGTHAGNTSCGLRHREMCAAWPGYADSALVEGETDERPRPLRGRGRLG